MKKIVIVVSLLASVRLQAQWVVYDPAVHSQSIANNAAEVAKFVEVINNQVQQINTLANQLTELRRYIDLFGNPAQVSQVTGVSGLIQDLQTSSAGMALTDIRQYTTGNKAMEYTGGGLYHLIGTEFNTPGGTRINRVEDQYRQFYAVPKAVWAHGNVYSQATERRQALKIRIRQATEQLEAATTDAETQKLTAVLVGLNAALAAVDKEIDFALGQVLVQDAENRNDKEKQAQARVDEQQAEFTESLTNFREVFRLSLEPAAFPED